MLNIYTNSIFYKHDTGIGHPESSRRLDAALSGVDRAGSSDRVLRDVSLHPDTDRIIHKTHSCEYEKELDAAPDQIRWYRLLASAYLSAHEHERARDVIDRGLTLEPDDPMLVGASAEARAGMGDPDGAWADWGRALELDPDDIGPLYMSAFVLERIGRRQEAIDSWQAIIDWSEARGYELDTIWPKQELVRLLRLASG